MSTTSLDLVVLYSTLSFYICYIYSNHHNQANHVYLYCNLSFYSHPHPHFWQASYSLCSSFECPHLQVFIFSPHNNNIFLLVFQKERSVLLPHALCSHYFLSCCRLHIKFPCFAFCQFINSVN